MLKACSACGHFRPINGACPKCGGVPRRQLSTTQRGYGSAHRKLHDHFAPLVSAGVVVCSRCRTLIQPGEAWDLGHDADRSRYNGPEHALCNRRAGGASASVTQVRVTP